jgi:hypothetical protein
MKKPVSAQAKPVARPQSNEPMKQRARPSADRLADEVVQRMMTAKKIR